MRSVLFDARSLGQAHVRWLDDLWADGTVCSLPLGRKTVAALRPGYVEVVERAAD
jgi:hypothetical protein